MSHNTGPGQLMKNLFAQEPVLAGIFRVPWEIGPKRYCGTPLLSNFAFWFYRRSS
jgi:hypothetical protein